MDAFRVVPSMTDSLGTNYSGEVISRMPSLVSIRVAAFSI
jgi:hypothetical protein